MDLYLKIGKQRIYIGWGKGATSYELQIWCLYFTYCFLKGGNWKHPFQLSRFRFRIDKTQFDKD